MGGVGLRNLYYAKTSSQHRGWLAVTGGSLLAIGLYYGFYPLIHGMKYKEGHYNYTTQSISFHSHINIHTDSASVRVQS